MGGRLYRSTSLIFPWPTSFVGSSRSRSKVPWLNIPRQQRSVAIGTGIRGCSPPLLLGTGVRWTSTCSSRNWVGVGVGFGLWRLGRRRHSSSGTTLGGLLLRTRKWRNSTRSRSSSSSSMATNLPKLPDVARLSTSVITVLGGNPTKFTLQGSNTYVLGTGPSRILLDTAQGFSIWKDNLAKVIKDENITISKCLLSHWHGDHVGGVVDFEELCPEASIWKAFGNSVDPDEQLTDVRLEVIEDGMKFTDGRGFEIEAVHCPGHTKDHMAFLITKSTDDSEVGAMFTADNVLGHGTAVFEDLATYLKSLDLMKSRLHRKARAYPGHGAVVEDAGARIDEYIAHRKMREDEALNVLRYGSSKKPSLGKEVVPGKEWGSMEMVKVIYHDVPEHLHQPAEKGLLMVLAKLKGEGKVVESNGRWKMGEKATL